MGDLHAWADQLTEAVHHRWVENGRLPAAGYRVFYAPVRMRPDLMIIGMNPGGGEEDFLHAHRHASPREGRAYLDDDGPLAKRMCDLGAALVPGNNDGDNPVTRSVALNVNFFRSKNTAEWLKVPNRLELEAFCLGMLGDIVAKLEPKAILAFGLATFDLLAAAPGSDRAVHFCIENGRGLPRQQRRLIVSSVGANLGGYGGTLIGMTHPTSTRGLTREVRAAMLERLASLITGVI